MKIESGYLPGAIGRIAELHAAYYSRHWNFGLYFEAKVATELSEFLLRHDPASDGIWLATTEGRIEGSIIIDGIHSQTQGAHLRWFILSHRLRGTGAGRRLITEAVDFCRQRQHHKIYLWTFEGLHAAQHLYQSAGFRLRKQQEGVQWGTRVNEQYYELDLI